MVGLAGSNRIRAHTLKSDRSSKRASRRSLPPRPFVTDLFSVDELEELKVLFSEDPAFVISKADKFLSSEPVVHNLILSILHSPVAQSDPGRYWIALHGEEAVGVVV